MEPSSPFDSIPVSVHCGGTLPPGGVCYLRYEVGCAPPGEQRERLKAKPVFDRGAGPFPALLVDGVIAGTWKREQRGRGVHVRVELFRRLTAAQRKELGAETERLGEFLGAEASLSFG